MKSIKYFQYKNTYEYEKFLNVYGYKLSDVKGFSYAGKKQYRGNILKEYCIHFKDGKYEYFKIVYFSSFNESSQSRLGFNGDKLLEWYENANVRLYKVKDIWGMNDKYVIEM